MRHWRRNPVPLSPPTPDDLVAVFVYGTLRHDERGPGWAHEAEVALPSRGTARGRLYYGPGFPYFIKDDGAGPVVGDLLLFDSRHPMYDHMCQVEIGAGYVPVEVEVTLESGATVNALAWNATERSRVDYCTPERLISNGDFHDYDAAAFDRNWFAAHSKNEEDDWEEWDLEPDFREAWEEVAE